MKRNNLVGCFGVAVLTAAVAVWTLASPGPVAARAEDGMPTAQRTAPLRSPEAATQQLEEEIALIRLRHELALKRLARQQDELLALESKVRDKQIELALLQAKLKRFEALPISQKESDALIARDPEVQRLTKEIDEVTRIMLDTVATLSKGKDAAEYKRLKQQRDELQAELAGRRNEALPDAMAEIRQRRQDQLEHDIAAAEEEILVLKRVATEQKEVLEKAVNQLREKAVAPGDAILNAKITLIEAKLTGIDTKLTTMDTKVSTLDGKLAPLDRKLTAVDGKLTPLDGKLNQILSRLEKIEKRLEKIEPPKK